MPEHTHIRRAPSVPSTAAPDRPSLPATAPRQPELSGGRALDRQTNAEMSARFGHDFSSVRIHTDARAEDSAGALGANAFALGDDIGFAAGKYALGSPETDRLLAHELTHVAQQARFGSGDWGRTSARGDASEREADSLSGQVLMGRSVSVQATPGAAIARDDAPAPGPAAPEDHSTRDYLINMASFAGGFLPGVGGLAAGALGAEESVRTLPDANDPMRGMKNAEGAAGFANGALGLAAGFGGFEGGAALGGSAATALTGGTLTGAAALGPATLVAGAGLAGMATGHYLAENTEVGGDTVGAIGGLDHLMGGKDGQSSVVALDDYRQQQWDKGGVGGVAKSIAAGAGEGAIGLAGAIGGLAEGAWHGLGALGSAMPDSAQAGGY